MTSWARQSEDYLTQLQARGAFKPAAGFFESLSAAWQSEGLQTAGGLADLKRKALSDLHAGIEKETGKRFGDLSAERFGAFDEALYRTRKSIELTPGLVGDEIERTKRVIETLPADVRQRLAPLADIDGIAGREAADIEAHAAGLAERAPGLGTTAATFAAGLARQMIDPENLLLGLVGTGPGMAVGRMLIAEAGLGAVTEALRQPTIQAERASLGLDAGWRQGVENVAAASVGQAGLAGLFRAGGVALRMARGAPAQGSPASVVATGAGVDLRPASAREALAGIDAPARIETLATGLPAAAAPSPPRIVASFETRPFRDFGETEIGGLAADLAPADFEAAARHVETRQAIAATDFDAHRSLASMAPDAVFSPGDIDGLDAGLARAVNRFEGRFAEPDVATVSPRASALLFDAVPGQTRAARSVRADMMGPIAALDRAAGPDVPPAIVRRAAAILADGEEYHADKALKRALDEAFGGGKSAVGERLTVEEIPFFNDAEARLAAGTSDGAPVAAPDIVSMGRFGPVLRTDDYGGRWGDLVARLSDLRGGEAPAALSHPEIGSIDVVWGEPGTGRSDGWGLSKIVEFHPEIVDDLPEVLPVMKVVSRSANRVVLEAPSGKALVRLDFDGKDKVWLLTAFRERKRGWRDGRTTGRSTGHQGDASSPSPAKSNIGDPTAASKIGDGTEAAFGRVVAEHPDMEIDLGDGRVIRAGDIDDDLGADARAAAELLDCFKGGLE